jgi:hypothetical protein
MKTTKTKTTTKAIHIAAAENVTALFELAEKDEGKARIYFLALAMQLKAEGGRRAGLFGGHERMGG